MLQHQWFLFLDDTLNLAANNNIQNYALYRKIVDKNSINKYVSGSRPINRPYYT